MGVLEAPGPLAEYRKITDEILLRMPDKDRYLRAAAESVRSFLLLRLGLKLTGSYEQASCAIQDTPNMIQQHYGRFLPQDKAALAAKISNQVWEAA
jgi:hypothetical protein